MLPPCFPFKWQTVAFSFFWLPGRISFEPETNRYFKHFNVCAKRKMFAPLSTTGAGARPRSKVTIVARPVAGLEWCPCPCPCSCPCTFPPRCQVGAGWCVHPMETQVDPPLLHFLSLVSPLTHPGNMCTSYFSAISQLE